MATATQFPMNIDRGQGARARPPRRSWMTMRSDDGKHLLLDPRFLIQLAGMLLIGAGLYYGLVATQNQQGADLGRLAVAVERIEARLPNQEAEALKYQALVRDLEALRAEVTEQRGWMQITRETLIKKGIL
jgi:hypothetical protein